jgi:RES domain
VIVELLPDRHHWYRIADADWVDPLDPSYAARAGGRWNPPTSWPTLYLNEDLVTARANLRRFIVGWQYEPEDLNERNGPPLAVATLPRRQHVADAHTPEGLRTLGLPATYPSDGDGGTVGHAVCHAAAAAVHDAGLRGVRARSAQTTDGVGREVAWYPASSASRARLVDLLPYDGWFWA